MLRLKVDNDLFFPEQSRGRVDILAIDPPPDLAIPRIDDVDIIRTLPSGAVVDYAAPSYARISRLARVFIVTALAPGSAPYCQVLDCMEYTMPLPNHTPLTEKLFRGAYSANLKKPRLIVRAPGWDGFLQWAASQSGQLRSVDISRREALPVTIPDCVYELSLHDIEPGEITTDTLSIAVDVVARSSVRELRLTGGYACAPFESNTVVALHLSECTSFRCRMPYLQELSIGSNREFGPLVDTSGCPRLSTVFMPWNAAGYATVLRSIPTITKPPVCFDAPFAQARALVVQHAPRLLAYIDNGYNTWTPNVHADFRYAHRLVLCVFYLALDRLQSEERVAPFDPAAVERIPRTLRSDDD